MLITMLATPMSTSLQMIGKQRTRYSLRNAAFQRKLRLRWNRKGYFCTFARRRITAAFTKAAMVVARAAPCTPRAGQPRLPWMNTQLRKIFVATEAIAA